ncbi:glycine cleavage system H protein, mitochondrial-like [Plodia interpunctella]|uniref:glycine cleavage system H protein, mitochondrial-like n=1 Tax=Plodia interpunctella TaxID=58824 RepID=UPI002367B6DD|nr:glycine cleavage system H protein, mitochondrial-like [Plodia interpunctella]
MALRNMVRVACQVTRNIQPHCCRQAAFFSTTQDNRARFYTKKHEWVSVNNDVGTVGISSYAQDALGEVVFAQLPDVGTTVKVGEECGALESVKAASEIYSPVSGAITEKNDSVESTPSLINKSCYEEGWLFRVKLSKPEELKALMDQTAYDKFLEEDHH